MGRHLGRRGISGGYRTPPSPHKHPGCQKHQLACQEISVFQSQTSLAGCCPPVRHATASSSHPLPPYQPPYGTSVCTLSQREGNPQTHSKVTGLLVCRSWGEGSRLQCKRKLGAFPILILLLLSPGVGTWGLQQDRLGKQHLGGGKCGVGTANDPSWLPRSSTRSDHSTTWASTWKARACGRKLGHCGPRRPQSSRNVQNPKWPWSTWMGNGRRG